MPNAPGADLARQLDEIRERRWATSTAEREDGVSAIATTVVDSTDRVVAALCISGPTIRLTSERSAAVLGPLERSAADVSGLLRRG